MRVGAGGIMLPNHSPLRVAELFRTLEAMFPGRIDLGLGRAPGTDGVTAWALRRSREAVMEDNFVNEAAQLFAFLDAGHAVPRRPSVLEGDRRPVVPSPPQIWMLGSSGYGGAFAVDERVACRIRPPHQPGTSDRVTLRRIAASSSRPTSRLRHRTP